jgi:protein involved in polysaccharide export with SLBB domain
MQIRSIRYFFVVILYLLFSLSQAVAQQQIPNLQEINVDELTDAQIESFIEQAESSGYSESQLEIMARARGMSESDISKLRSRINEVRNGTNNTTGAGGIDRLRQNEANTFSRQQTESNRSTIFDPFEHIFPVDTIIQEELEIFGMSFFENSANSFEPSLNVATPANYLLGPGDQVIIDVWGASEQSYILDISPQGSILVPEIGPIYLNGYTMDRAEQRIKYRLKSIYSTLDQNTFAQVSLGQLRTINVNVVGEVKQPGSYPLSAFATALNALQAAGGPNENGSFREIKIFRSGKLVGTEDLYEVLSIGGGLNLKLQDQDVVLVPAYLNRVAIDGAVKRPAYYEMKTGERLVDGLNYAGGFAENAYKKSLSIRRNLDNVKTVKTIESEFFNTVSLELGDAIEIGEIQGRYTKRVRVEGAVNHPGEFEIKEGMRLSDALDLADGLRGDAYMERGILIRELPNFELQSIAFSPKSVQTGADDLILKEEDLIKIQSRFDIKENYQLTIQGEVQQTGDFPYSEGMTVEDLIYLAGGFKETAAKSFVEVARRIQDSSRQQQGSELAEIFNFPIRSDLKMSDESNYFVLQPFDLVVVRKSPIYEKQKLIEIEGEVNFPGDYVLGKRDERISDLIDRAGGLTKFAYVEGATLIRRTEYFIDSTKIDIADETSTAALIRKRELQDQFKKDTLVKASKEKFKMQESIGIRLDKILEDPEGEYDLIMKEGDVLSIPKQLQTVRVRGEVLYPSTVRFKQGTSMRYFISQAGGFTDGARKGKSYVIYANGSAQKTFSFLGFRKFPQVKPGAELVIPTKPERRGLTPGEVTSLAVGLATFGNIIVNLIPN